MTIRYISDLHFNHTNMAYKRMFLSPEEMNELIIENWNKTVKSSKDITYILGDITMERIVGYELLDQLRGVKHVVLGNHDQRQHTPELLKHVSTVSGIITDKKRKIIITHCPIHPCELEYRFEYNIHGHVHENTLQDWRYINVSCEEVDYTPRTLEELLEKSAQMKQRLEIRKQL